ncbi:MAG: hypothetical protein IJ468_06810 [Lachnospiraceae bacterium]|nr:hypothetical protein [Lachnospiraceae bacterium]
MKLKLIVKLVEKLLGMKDSGDNPRADMYLPERLLALGIVLAVIGIVLGIGFACTLTPWMLPAALVCILIGIAAVMCWKNQTIRILSDETFEYTTFLGKTHVYAFRDITALIQNNDSFTLIVGGNKVHIESMAVLSPRFVELMTDALKKNA